MILEGMVLGKPVISTNFRGPAEIIEDKVSGCLVEPNDPKALARQIDYLLSHDEEAQKIGEEGKRRVYEKFDLRFNIERTEAVYSSVVRK
jgi:glycosyltransferase involved in cell wall biosynthesis